jgi:crotonobetainyl-CoA:carnitine CoA-transferase CaiB-like acyl-CoA transferase
VVRDLAGLQNDPQLAARKHFVRLGHRVLGELAFERAGSRLSADPGRLDRPGPGLGEHSHGILSGILGLSEKRIAELVADGINV